MGNKGNTLDEAMIRMNKAKRELEQNIQKSRIAMERLRLECIRVEEIF